MRTIYRLLLFCAVVSAVVSCKKEKTPTDNVFAFKEYISHATTGRQSISQPIQIQLNRALTQYEINQELPSNILQITPKVKGTLSIKDGHSLYFKPDSHLAPATTYDVALALDKLYDDIPKVYQSFRFAFQTITPDFNINLGALQSYDPNYNYLEGQIEASDVIAFAKAKQLITATQDGKQRPITWFTQADTTRYHLFKIDSISREIEDSMLEIAWDGDPINASETKGANAITIPGKNNFNIVDIRHTNGANAAVAINFSDPLAAQQNFNGLVSIEGAGDLRFEVEGNILHVYPENRIVGNTSLEVFQGIKSIQGYSLKEALKEMISFEQLKPAVRLVSNGVILPDAATTPYYFEAVNLSHVDVRIIKIFEDNVLQYLQQNALNTSNNYNLNRVGRRIAKKTFEIATPNTLDKGMWKAHGIDLSALFKADPGALYRIEISFKPEYALYDCDNAVPDTQTTDTEGYYEDDYESEYVNDTASDEELREQQYWDNRVYSWRNRIYNWRQENNPCHPAYYQEEKFLQQPLLGSDLGLIVKRGKDNSYLFAATDLISTTPEANTKITLYNYQKQAITQVTTDATGTVRITPEAYASFAIAQKGNNYAYLKLEDGNALSMSSFDIAGKELKKGRKGFVYTERGVHRPGDTIQLTFVLDDRANKLPKNHPVKLEVNDARGSLVYRKVLSLGSASTLDQSDALDNFYHYAIPTAATAPTGNWNAVVRVGGTTFSKSLKVETIKPNRLKVTLDFEDDIINASGVVNGKAKVAWLHGAPARKLKIKSTATLRSANTGLEQYPSYQFYDPTRRFEQVELSLLDGTLNNEGSIPIKATLALSKRAPGMLEAAIVTKAYEGGGDFSLDVVTKKVAPFDHFVGIKSPKGRAYGSYYTDQDISFDLVTTNAQGKPVGKRKLEVKIYKMSWRWWWNRNRDRYASYESGTVHTPVKSMTISTDANGRYSLDVNIPEARNGRYLIRVVDPESGHATGRIAYFYRNWNNISADAESTKMLVFAANKPSYEVGEEAVISFPSGNATRALVTIENGSSVLDTRWVETTKRETQFSLPVTANMAPNVYVNISLLQPHKYTKNDLPIRLYGVIPLLVTNATTLLEPHLQMPETLKPEMPYSITVSEKTNKPMTYTIAVVDEGLLDLTRFKTPDIHKHFYSKEALGVKSFDVFDDVIGAFSGSVEHMFAIGGGDAAAAAKNRKADRFKPVVRFLGPFSIAAGQSKTHQLQMPNYVGSVRAMLVAGHAETGAYGSTQKTVAVKKPLMVLGSLPRKLAPKEKLVLPVTVFAMDPKIKNATVTVTGTKAFKATGALTKRITFDKVGEQIVPFEFDISQAVGMHQLRITAQGHGEQARYDIEIEVENPNPISQKVTDYKVQPNGRLPITFRPFGVTGTNETIVEFSTLPPINFTKRLRYLIQYPHGCIEQTTSGVFPQLYMDDLFDLTYDQKQEVKTNISAGIERLGQFQTPNGGLSYWPGEGEADPWGTNYAGHFMIEAKKKGFALPLTFMSNWLRFQKRAAREWRPGRYHYNSQLVQAYRLYTLALAGEPDLAAMNRLRELGDLSNDSKWRLAATYALVGQQKVAKALAAVANIDIEKDPAHSYTYGSVFRNRAMALETLVILGDVQQRDLAVALANTLSSDRWLSTQETSYALLAFSKMVAQNGGTAMKVQYIKDGVTATVDTNSPMAAREVPTSQGNNEMILINDKDNTVFVRLIQAGKLPLGEELSTSKNLRVATSFVDTNNSPITIDQLRQGTEFTAQIVVQNTSGSAIDNVALTQFFPSGWEIVNTRFTDAGGGTTSSARYTDIRDDKVMFYFDLNARASKTFTVRVNASYLGTYYLPGTQAEAMYDNNYLARTKGKWIKIQK